MDFWWEAWPTRAGYDVTERQRDKMWDTFQLAWDDGVRDPTTFFGTLTALGYTVYSSWWDEWRDWYDEVT